MGVASKLSAHRQVENIKFLAKNSASQPAPKDLIAGGRGELQGRAARLGD
jgi:hypothetical protein